MLNNLNIKNYIDVMKQSNLLYQKGFNTLDIINLINNDKLHNINNNVNIHELVLIFSKIQSVIKNEKLLLAIILNNLYLSSNIKIENVLFM
jgi:hypothetical protein